MSELSELSVNRVALQQLARTLCELAERSEGLAGRLSTFEPETGRPDSDVYGRLGPNEGAELLDGLSMVLSCDGCDVALCGERYAEAEQFAIQRLLAVLGRLL